MTLNIYVLSKVLSYVEEHNVIRFPVVVRT
jgi:hypothetical protein